MRKLTAVLCIAIACIAAFMLWRGFQSPKPTAVDVSTVVPPSRLDAELSVQQAMAASQVTGDSADAFVGSEACKSCHVDQHASWHQTYHRSMTMLATEENVLAPFDGVLEIEGQTYQLTKETDQQTGDTTFWVESDDPEWERTVFQAGGDVREETPHRRKSQIVMTTGSHHFQAYWIRSDYGRELWQFPLRYDLTENAWVHRKDVFLGPPEWRPGMHFKVWNDNCIFCHATGGQPGRDPQSSLMEHTTIAELGIACESCHGPGREHLAKHSLAVGSASSGDVTSSKPEATASASNSNASKGSVVTSASASSNVTHDDSIVNPAKLDHERSSEICGACHSNFLHDDPDVMVIGPQFRPGRRLTEFGRFFTPQLEKDSDIVSRFWSDGTNRSTGREFMGVKSSPCYKRGEMSCLSCHSMHNSDPDDQLAKSMESNEACLQCHENFRDTLQEHTHHAPGSAGSLCYNCHMPYTNYGLFKATRSHSITSPKVSSISHKSRPNACNLCHLDQSLAWTAEHLNEWYDQPRPDLQSDEEQTSAWAIMALRGDAGQRAIAAWIARWTPAQEVSGVDWIPPILKELEEDPYTAVAYVAKASAKRLGQSPVDDQANNYDAKRVTEILGMSQRSKAITPDAGENAAVALSEFIQELRARRDTKPIASVE